MTPRNPRPGDWSEMQWEAVASGHGSMRMQRVLEHLPPGARNLDLGTGNGDGTLLASEVTRCVGLEYGSKSTAFAASKGCRMVRGDARQLPFAAASFDSVTCLDVLEHIPRPAVAVREMVRVLCPGGVLILQTPNAEIFKERLLRLVRSLGYRQLQPYDVPLPLAEIRRLLAAADLKVERDRPIRVWAPNPVQRWISWSRLFVCRKGA